jgi:hemerythrin superfamily protein
MPTKTKSKSSTNQRVGTNAGAIVGAAIAGAAVGLAANVGRKLFIQFSGSGSDWFETLRQEHQTALAIFDEIEATDDSQTMLRSNLLARLKYALTKHASQEENVIYPALHEADDHAHADELTSDHGYVKTYLYELEGMAKDDPAWLARVSDFRAMLEQHIREEEEDIFPALQAKLSDTKTQELTAMMAKEGFKLA